MNSSSYSDRVMRPLAAALAVLALGAAAGCGGKDPPTDCGDSTMSIVTFVGPTSDEEDRLRSCIDIHAAARRDATATSPGRDDSFATSQPGVIPWTDLTFQEAVEACGRAGKFLCNSEELAAIAPVGLGIGEALYDTTTIDALYPNDDTVAVPHRFDPLNPYDMVIRGETGKPPFPETVGSVAYFTVSPVRQDKSRDPSIPLILGRLTGDGVASGVLTQAPVLEKDFHHPLVGFRCCINAKMRDAFEPLPPNPALIREEEPDVPIASP